MKSPNSPRPSGDRKIARLLMAALGQIGFEVELASELRSWEGRGDHATQQLIRSEAIKVSEQLIATYQSRPENQRPVAWFTYHLYHKAPDWIGPLVCKALGIPYLIAEASVAAKQKGGKWNSGYFASCESVSLATKLFVLNPQDRGGLESVIGESEKIISLLPFLDLSPATGEQKRQHRRDLAARLRIDSNRYWLICVAMMRDDSKLRSYEQLARIIERLQRKDWLLLIVGDGAAALQVRDYFRLDLEPDRQVYFLGKRDSDFIQAAMSASDLMIWPAINEAIGMVALEALAAALPTICGRSGGIDQIVRDGETGLLLDSPENNDAPLRFAEAIETLLSDPARLASMSGAAGDYYQKHHIDAVSEQLSETLWPLVKR